MGQQLNFYGEFNFYKKKQSESELDRTVFKSNKLDPKPIELTSNRTDGSNTHLLQKMVMIGG